MPLAQAENRTRLKDAAGKEVVFAEQTTARMTMTLLDETGVAVPLAGIDTATLTIYAREEPSQPVINSVDQVNIKNTGRGTIHATSGLLTLVLDPADNAIHNPANDLEWHRLLIEIGYSTTKKLKYEIDVPVRNLYKVT
jgi:hypothetical protein